mgnify:FL=1
MKKFSKKAVVNGDLMDSLKQMAFLTMMFLTFYMKVRIITAIVSIISWLSVLYALNGRKVTVWILIRYEKVNI